MRIVGLLAMGVLTVSSLFTILVKPQAFASLFNANRDLAMNSDLLMVGAKLKEPISGPISSPISGPLTRVPKPKVTEFLAYPTITPKITLTPGPLTGTVVPLATPTLAVKRVFLTSGTYQGNLGGLVGADAKCQVSAEKVSLGGIWKAWLSDDKIAVNTRLSQANVYYQRLDGIGVALGWNDLIDGSLLNPINVTENKTVVNTGWAWTGSTAYGQIMPPTTLGTNCANWTSTTSGTGSTGAFSRIDQGWSEEGAFGCYIAKPLYCVEQ
jgi:hypothetical protein